MGKYTGGCLCKQITYQVTGKPGFPHLCSCTMCQKWSGALTVAWVEFPLNSLIWNGPNGKPAFYRSSAKTQRCFCPNCGGTLAAIDDNYDQVSITIASLDHPAAIIPGKQHSYQKESPHWWKVNITQ